MNGYNIPGLDEAQQEIEAHKEAEMKKVAEAQRAAALVKRRQGWAEFYGKLMPFVEAKVGGMNAPHLMVTLNKEANYENEVLVLTNTTLKVGIGLGRWIEIKDIHRKVSSWRRGEKIGTMMNVGSYGALTTFRQLKSGEWKWEEIAQTLVNLALSEFNRVAAERRKVSNDKVVAAFRAKHKLNEWGAFRPSTVKELPIRCELKIDKAMTIEQAEKLLSVMQELGVCVS
jgi:hypothetical protein